MEPDPVEFVRIGPWTAQASSPGGGETWITHNLGVEAVWRGRVFRQTMASAENFYHRYESLRATHFGHLEADVRHALAEAGWCPRDVRGHLFHPRHYNLAGLRSCERCHHAMLPPPPDEQLAKALPAYEFTPAELERRDEIEQQRRELIIRISTVLDVPPELLI